MLRGYREAHTESLHSQSDLPPARPPYGPNWAHKISQQILSRFFFLPYISFIIAFRALEWDSMYGESI